MKAPEVKNRQNAKMLLFSLLSPECISGPKNYFWPFWAIWSTFSLFRSKWPKMASREPMKHRTGAFLPKNPLFLPQSCQNGKKCENYAIFDFRPQKWLFAHFLTFCPWGGHLRKRMKNLVVYWDFWDPKSQKSHFGHFFAKFHTFCDLALKNAKITILSPKWEKSRNFHFLRFGGPDGHTYRGQDPQSLPPSRASGTKPVGGAPLPPTPICK